jgi:hypothetical protein
MVFNRLIGFIFTSTSGNNTLFFISEITSMPPENSFAFPSQLLSMEIASSTVEALWYSGCIGLSQCLLSHDSVFLISFSSKDLFNNLAPPIFCFYKF